MMSSHEEGKEWGEGARVLIADLQGNVTEEAADNSSQLQCTTQVELQTRNTVTDQAEGTITSDQSEHSAVTSNQSVLPEISGQSDGPARSHDMTSLPHHCGERGMALTCREGRQSPEIMRRGTAAVQGDMAFFNSCDSCEIYAYRIATGTGATTATSPSNGEGEKGAWFKLPAYPYKFFSLAVIGGVVTGVGGVIENFIRTTCTADLLSLIVEGGGGEGGGERGRGGRSQKWSKFFPPMPTPRGFTGVVTTETVLVVAGGGDRESKVNLVEIMDVATKQWSTACPLPRPLTSITGGVCNGRLYLGGYFYNHKRALSESYLPSQAILYCDLATLTATKYRVIRNVTSNRQRGVVSNTQRGVATDGGVGVASPGVGVASDKGDVASNEDVGVSTDIQEGVSSVGGVGGANIEEVGGASNKQEGVVSGEVGMASATREGVASHKQKGVVSNEVGVPSAIQGGVASRNLWSYAATLPISCSTLIALNDSLVAVGGKTFDLYSDAVYRYDSNSDSWNVIGRLRNRRSLCLAAIVPGNRLVVVGGLIPDWLSGTFRTNYVDILSVL